MTAKEQRRVLWFRRFALIGALLAACVVVLGAWVRLTDAGLGCPDWPGCYGHAFPQTTHHFAQAVHEMVHRYVASTLGLIIVSLLVWAIVNRRNARQPVWPVAALFLLVCVQGALGMKTVTLLLLPLIVTAHLLGGLSTLALLWWLSLEPAPRQLSDKELRLRAFAVAGLSMLAFQIALGGWTSSNYAAVALPRFADLPEFLVAVHGLSRCLRTVARPRHRLRGRRARESRESGHSLHPPAGRSGRRLVSHRTRDPGDGAVSLEALEIPGRLIGARRPDSDFDRSLHRALGRAPRLGDLA